METIIYSKNDEEIEIYSSFYTCPLCKNPNIMVHSNYCFNCGERLQWQEKQIINKRNKLIRELYIVNKSLNWLDKQFSYVGVDNEKITKLHNEIKILKIKRQQINKSLSKLDI